MDVDDGSQRWSGRFERKVGEDFAGEEALAQVAMRRELGSAPAGN